MENSVERVESDGIEWWCFSQQPSTDAAPLVILHGLFGSADNWSSYGKILSADRVVLIPDLPNHGASLHTSQMGFAQIAGLLWDSLAHTEYLDSERPIAILGHSMGGKVAMAMAFSRPGAVERLIIADIAPVEYPRRHDDIFTAMRDVLNANVASRGEADRLMAAHIPEKAVRMFLLKSLVADDNGTSGRRYRWSLNVDDLQSSYDEIRGWPFSDETYDGPALVIAGGMSPYVTDDGIESLRHHLPSVRVETIPDAGHWLHAERRDEFLAFLQAELG